MPLSSYLRDALLDHVLKGSAFTQPTNIYISCHTGDPGLTGANEATGGSYARQLANSSFDAASGGTKSSGAIVDFTGMPAATITYIGVWDALTVGNFLWGMALTAPKTVGAGDTLRFPAGDIDATMT